MGRFNLISAGADFRRVEGDSNEDAYNAISRGCGRDSAANPAVTNPSPWEDLTPGTLQAVLALQRVSAAPSRSPAFVQDVMTPTDRLTVTLSARLDHWRNYDSHNLETAVIRARRRTTSRT